MIDLSWRFDFWFNALPRSPRERGSVHTLVLRTGPGLRATPEELEVVPGKGAVGEGAYVVGHEAEEGVAAMLARIGALRQWGLGKRRRVGVLVRRLETAEDVPVAAVLREAAAQGLAGVAVMGEAAALARYDAAGKLADELGIFLVVCTASETGEAR